MKTQTNRSWNFSISERRGVYLMLGIMLGLCLHLQQAQKPQQISAKPANVRLDSLLATITQPEKIEVKEKRVSRKSKPNYRKKKEVSESSHSQPRQNLKPKNEAHLIPSVDLNLATREQIALLPLSDFVKGNIIKYRNAGGTFKKKEDLKKIYGVDDSTFESVKKHISIPPPEPRKKKSFPTFEPKKEFKKPAILDINKATAEGFSTLKGIGPVLSERIVKYRTRLGGFVNTQQIASTYGLQDSIYQKIKPFLIYSSPKVSKININTCDTKALSRHPYISYRLAQVIINFRKQHGAYRSVDDLSIIKIMDTATLEKIRPYLNVHDADDIEEIVSQVDP